MGKNREMIVSRILDGLRYKMDPLEEASASILQDRRDKQDKQRGLLDKVVDVLSKKEHKLGEKLRKECMETDSWRKAVEMRDRAAETLAELKFQDYNEEVNIRAYISSDTFGINTLDDLKISFHMGRYTKYLPIEPTKMVELALADLVKCKEEIRILRKEAREISSFSTKEWSEFREAFQKDLAEIAEMDQEAVYKELLNRRLADAGVGFKRRKSSPEVDAIVINNLDTEEED